MFRPLGLYKQIKCPRQYDCNLQNCIFDHDSYEQPNGTAISEAYDPLSAGDAEPPPSKRRRIASPAPESTKPNDAAQERTAIALSQRPLQTPNVNHQASKADPRVKVVVPSGQQTSKPVKPSELVSVKRHVSPPPKREPKTSPVEKAEKLIPRPVAKAPALLKVRMSLIEVLYKQMQLHNSQLDDKGSESKMSKLTDQQMIKWVLDEEEQAAAKLGSDIYRNTMSQKILQMKKMKLENFQSFIDEKFGAPKSTEGKIDTKSSGLPPEGEIQILKYLRTNLTGLDAHGYVTKAPSTVDIQKAKDAVKAASGYEICDRCGVRFQVFPGRDEQGRLTTKGECHYHWAKLHKSAWQKTDHITGQAQASYPCCSQQPGTEGCTQAATHVFKVTDVRRLASLLQFEPTPPKTDGKSRGPVAFDCEMAYTTYGMEVVRVTAVSWPKNQELLDILVRPYGEILDLNTRFSGVTPDQFANALPYDAEYDPGDNTSKEGEIAPESLRKVDSPATARQLMFDLLAPETPLIGHAIDNDLNTCRMIHPFVIDTVLLYPHPRGLPIRYGLKMLASMHLQRSIQTGGAAGHDSKEDSIATGDLVRIKVAEKWQMMRLQGWKFHEGNLVPPGR